MMQTRRLLVYGAPGSGKTTLALSFPKPVYVFDFDGGLPEGIKGVDSDFYGSSPKDTVSNCGYTKFKTQWYKLLNEKHDYKTIVIDTITGFQDILAKYIQLVNGWKDGVPRNQTLPFYGMLGDYGKQFANEVRQFKDINLIVTAYEQLTKDDVSGDILAGPNMDGNKVVPKIIGAFSDMFYMKADYKDGKAIYNTYISQYRRYQAKNRLSIHKEDGTIEHVFEDPVLTNLNYKMIENAYNKKIK